MLKMNLLEAIERLNNFCKEVKEVKERECKAKYDVEAIEMVLQELEKSNEENERLKEHYCPYNFCPYKVEQKGDEAIEAQPIMPEVKPPEVKPPKMEDVKIDLENLVINIDKLGESSLIKKAARQYKENIMKGGGC